MQTALEAPQITELPWKNDFMLALTPKKNQLFACCGGRELQRFEGG